MKKELRYYQSEAIKAVIDAWNEKQNHIPYCSIMTGLGKSLILSDITNKALSKGKRVLQLVPRLELVEQNYKEAINYCDSAEDIGIICSQINKSDLSSKAIIAMASSLYNKRSKIGKVDVLLADECHRISNDENSQYRVIIADLIKANPKLLIAGFTATPYRLGQGMLHEKCLKGKPLFNKLVYDTSVSPGIATLIDQGYMAHVQVMNTGVNVDLSEVKLKGKDYDQDLAGVKFDVICDEAVEELKGAFDEYAIQTAILFTSTLDNANHIINLWGGHDIRLISGDMDKHSRLECINWIKNHKGRRILVNVNILTEGFDFPQLDAVVLMRATTSPGLMVQMIGRLVRPHEGKIGMLWDYGTNIERLGTIDNIIPPKNIKKRGEAPQKLCLLCNTPNLMSAKKCKECEALFISGSEEGKYSMRSKTDALAEKLKLSEQYYEITDIQNQIAYSRSNNIPMIKLRFFHHYAAVHDEYLFLDHQGNIANKSKAFVRSWFVNAMDFYKLGEEGQSVANIKILLDNAPEYFKPITSITVVPDGKYKRLKSVEYG